MMRPCGVLIVGIIVDSVDTCVFPFPGFRMTAWRRTDSNADGSLPGFGVAMQGLIIKIHTIAGSQEFGDQFFTSLVEKYECGIHGRKSSVPFAVDLVLLYMCYSCVARWYVNLDAVAAARRYHKVRATIS
jgi:hypothetical protein